MNKTVLTSFTILCLLPTVFLAGFRISVRANSNVIHVPDDYQKIQWAIGNASIGDTIYVRSGIYYEHVIVNKPLSLMGENRETTIIDGNHTGTVVYIESSDCIIERFTIQNGGSFYPDKYVFLEFSHNSIVKDNRIRGSFYSGIDLTDSNNVSIVGNEVLGLKLSFLGIYVLSCKNCSIQKNIMIENDHGIRIYDSEGITIDMNSFLDNMHAIDVWFSQYNHVLKNLIVRHYRGIDLLSSNFTIIEENKVEDCYGSGIWLTSSHNNTIYHNNFFDNNRQVFIDDSCDNIFDDGVEGNYWSDYNGTDTNEDGIGDTPYIIDQNNRDNYPLMALYIPPAQIRVLYYDLLKKFNELLSWYNLLNQTYQRLPGNITNLQGQIDSLNSTFQTGQESMIGELTNIRNLMYVFIALTTILMATTVYLAIRKPKIRP